MQGTGRPQSRGQGPMGMGPQQMGQTGMRGGPPTGQGMRPGTNMGQMNMGATMAVPGGLAPVTGGTRGGMSRAGVGTRGGVQVPVGVGAHTEVRVADRPMTNHGLSGMKTGSVGPKRQIHDRTYFLVELGRRCKDLETEVTFMNKEIDQIREDGLLHTSLDKRYEALVKTVRSLEGDLADHNLATDKQRTDTRPEEVHHMYMLMKQQNDQQRSDVDQIFLEKRSHEDELQRINAEIGAITRASEERLNELHPDQHREYQVLKEDSLRISGELAEARDDLDQVNGRLMELESHLSRDVLRAQGQDLLKERKVVEERLEAIELEARQCSMSVPEQRELLLSKVKTDNADIVATEKKISDHRMENEGLKKQIREVATDAQEKKDDNDHQKYEILFTKDQEMTSFIESFEESRREEEQRREEKELNILRLLENISTAVKLESGITPDGYMKDMEDELDFKSKQLQNSETTQNRLEGELSKRQNELEKIQDLDTKISRELQQVEANMHQYELEIVNKFDKLEDMRGEVMGKKQVLEVRKDSLELRATALKQQVGFLKLRHESRRQQLKDDETASNLEAQETKIRQFGQTLQALNSFIQQKSAETDVRSETSFCLSGAEQMNQMLVTGRLC